jgi:choline-sulfatase
MMSGMYASDVGSYCNSTPFDGRVPSWCRRLRDSGYYGLATGKLDLVAGVDYGFEEVATTHGHDENPDIIHVDDGRVRRLLEFLDHKAAGLGRPWLFHLGLELPHHPYVAHARFKNRYLPELVRMPNLPPGYLETMPLALQAQRNFKLLSTPVPEERTRRARAAYYAMIEELDNYVGLILDRLEQSGQAQNTIVVLTSDHGEMHGEHGLWLKNNLLEDSARVPLMIAGPGIPAGKTFDTPVSQVDLVATLLELGGLQVPRKLRGTSLVSMMQGQPSDHPGYCYGESHSEGNITGSFMIRRGPWKYLHFSWYHDLLFNLEEDPGELRNLASKPEHASVQRELRDILHSLVDPPAVTEQAFQEQERRLQAMVHRSSADEFYQILLKRLGPGQAGTYTNHHFPGFRGPQDSGVGPQ